MKLTNKINAIIENINNIDRDDLREKLRTDLLKLKKEVESHDGKADEIVEKVQQSKYTPAIILAVVVVSFCLGALLQSWVC